MILPDSIGKPKILPICPRMMLSAMPFRNPTRIGFERKSASAPNFRKLPAMQRAPVKTASAIESDKYKFASPIANGATAAATSAHVPESGPMIS